MFFKTKKGNIQRHVDIVDEGERKLLTSIK